DLGSRSAEVDVGDAAVAAEAGEEDFRALEAIRKNGGREAVRGGVLLCDRVIEGIDGDEVENRCKRFRLHERPFIARPHDRRLDEVPGPGNRVAAIQNLATG